MKPEKLNQDFQNFLKTDHQMVNSELDQRILGIVAKELNPSHQKVFFKLISIQAFIGTLTLLFCPQFQLSLTNNYELFHYFHHRFGENICMMICGSIFLGSGSIFATYLLNRVEIQKIQQSTILYHLSMSIIFLSVFLLIGTGAYLVLNIFWLLGASISGILLFEMNRKIKSTILGY